MDESDRAARQVKLQKALSAAYLNHQISELENRVQGLAVGAAPNDLADATKSADPQRPARIDDSDEGEGRGRDFEEGRGREEDEETRLWRVVVVDVSGLMWAPKSVRKLVENGWEVVVPLEAIRTLDLLKKGSSPSSAAARAAARYLEHSSRHHRALSADPSVLIQTGTNYRRGRGLRLQRDDETADPASVSDLPPMPVMGGGEPPRWVRNVVDCASYFVGIMRAERDVDGEMAVLLVANPPLSVEVAQHLAQQEAQLDRDYSERGEGVLVSQEAERFELACEVLRDEEGDVPLGTRSRGGRGRGEGRGAGRGGGRGGRGEGGRGGGRGGRGGRGGGGGGGGRSRMVEDGEPKEIKILLRRPASDGESASVVMVPPGVASDGMGSPLPPPPMGLEPPPPPPPFHHHGPPPPFGPHHDHHHHHHHQDPQLSFGRPPPPFPSPHHFPPHDHDHHHHHSHQHAPGGFGRGGGGHFRPSPPPPPFDDDMDDMPRRRGGRGGGGGGGGGRRGGGRGGGRGRGGQGHRGGEFELLQRPVAGVGARGEVIHGHGTDEERAHAPARRGGRKEEKLEPRVVLLQRPK